MPYLVLLAIGWNNIEVTVTAEDSTTIKTYSVQVYCPHVLPPVPPVDPWTTTLDTQNLQQAGSPGNQTVLSPDNTQDENGIETAPSETIVANYTLTNSQTIDYVYDSLDRLTEANYSSGDYNHYSYDANGNRDVETTQAGTTAYLYDIANRLTSVGGVTFIWDNNGNLTQDTTNKYRYDHANRLTAVTDLDDAPLATYSYSGLGDRLTENGTQFVLDLNAGLTQVLQDGTYTYLYGSDRLMQQSQTSTGYFLGDALGSVRQLVDENGSVTLTKTYEPYGELASSSGLSAATVYGYTGEYTSSYIKLLYLRSRYYSLETGRFLTKELLAG